MKKKNRQIGNLEIETHKLEKLKIAKWKVEP